MEQQIFYNSGDPGNFSTTAVYPEYRLYYTQYLSDKYLTLMLKCQ